MYLKGFKRLFKRDYNSIIDKLESLLNQGLKADIRLIREKGKPTIITFSAGGDSYKLDLTNFKGFKATALSFNPVYTKTSYNKVLKKLETKIEYIIQSSSKGLLFLYQIL